MKAVRALLIVFLGLLFSAVTLGQVQPRGIFVPARFRNLEGDNLSGVLNAGPMRYQQVYGAPEFSDINPLGGYISSISFRPDGGQGHTFGVTVRDIEVHLSTTQRSPDGLSLVFAENVGLDDMIVRSGSGYLQSGGGPTTHFDTHLFFSTPFFYNPSAGNLLVDVRYRSGEPTTFFDATEILGDSLSCIWADSPSSPTATRLGTGGLITLFGVTPVPEPSAGVLLLVGLGCLGFFARRLLKGRN